MIEKPFGRDLASAIALNTQVHEAFEESQVFRIDHYLGKETVQNILVLRFANGIFEPVWNRNFVDHVQITVAESIGVEGRGRFYEEAGALRDIVQNHLLQVLSFVAMEPPASFEAEAVRDERAKVLGALRPMRTTDVVRGQYAAGFSEGVPVPGYVEEEGVAPNSVTETFVAARVSLDNWRWADTPFYLRTGKRLPKRVTEVAIQFKRVPHLPFSYAAAEQLEPNVLVLRIQPDEGISLRFGAKVPATRTQIRTVNMDFDYGTAFSSPTAEAYETLLLDAMRGDPTNFTRQDAVTESWRVVEPVLEAWQRQGGAPHLYAAGTWGPDAADDLHRPRREALAATVSVTLSTIEATLADLREHETSGSGRGVRTHMLDLVVFCDRREQADQMVEVVASLPYSRPSRAIIALGLDDESDVVADARVFCTPVSGDSNGVQVCSEIVSLSSGRGGIALPSLVAGLLLPDLPVFLHWRAEPDASRVVLSRLWELATRVVVDSTAVARALDSISTLVQRQPARSRHGSLVDEDHRLARGRRARLRQRRERGRARAADPHRDHARRHQRCPGAPPRRVAGEPHRAGSGDLDLHRGRRRHARRLVDARRAHLRLGALPRDARRGGHRARRGAPAARALRSAARPAAARPARPGARVPRARPDLRAGRDVPVSGALDVRVHDTRDQAVETFCELIWEAAPRTLVLTGGSTAGDAYRLLARPENRDRLDWGAVELLFGDERRVPPDSPDSNYRLVAETLLAGVRPGRVERMLGEAADPDAEATRYAGLIPEQLDVTLLGMGEDGHCASLFPGEPRARRDRSPRGAEPRPLRAVRALHADLSRARPLAARAVLRARREQGRGARRDRARRGSTERARPTDGRAT